MKVDCIPAPRYADEIEDLTYKLKKEIFALEFAEAGKGYKPRKLGKHRTRRLVALRRRLKKLGARPTTLDGPPDNA